MFDRAKLIADLIVDEAMRFTVYDDANPGAKVGPGYRLIGHPTVGIGHALDLTPFTADQARTICGWDIDAKAPALYAAFPWMSSMSEPRQRALADMAFNMGVVGLQGFHTFLGLMQAGKFSEAAADLETTAWHRQVGARALRVEALIRQG